MSEYEGERFVFGSNLAGRHGKGAALDAVRNHGAKLGVGIGPMGNAYAIPTKDAELKSLPLRKVAIYIAQFKAHARNNPRLKFMVTQIGCGYAGNMPHEIAPFFLNSPDNVFLPATFLEILFGKVDESRVSFYR